MILLIDNYDSFSYNLYQLIGSINPDIQVVRNDKIGVLDIAEMSPFAIFLSPGPGKPSDAGICEAVVRELGSRIPIFGVCLGHQAIVEALGGTVGYAQSLMHGKTSLCETVDESILFDGLPSAIKVGRYHSLSADGKSIPSSLRVTAISEDGEVMAVEGVQASIFGVQFHPESIMTPDGKTIISNFLKHASESNERNGK